MNNTKDKIIYRYPGSQPFTISERDLFFGRNQEIKQLTEFILSRKLVVLYGKSGLGKTSLLNAGVIPLLKETESYIPVFIRFGSKTATNNISPLQIVKQRLTELFPQLLKQITGQAGNFISDKITATDNSLWFYFKSLQLIDPEHSRFILVFDQFEEVFTYPDEQIEEFSSELAGLLYDTISPKVKKILSRKLERNRKFLTEQENTLLYQPVTVKSVMAIRSDRMSRLNDMTTHLPNILLNNYELQALARENAREGIVEPAIKNPPKGKTFKSPPFEYSANCLNKILDYLTENNRQRVESFQLQLICQYAESIVTETGKTQVVSEDLGSLPDIFKQHYQLLISKLTEKERDPARKLIEDRLIVDGNRIPLPDKVILKEQGISENLLQKLVNTRLLRAEPNNVGGISYELSHDTLIDPVLEAGKARIEKEEAERKERIRNEELRKEREKAEQERIEREKERKRQRQVIIIVSIAAIVSLLFGIYGFRQKIKADQTLIELKSEQFNKYKRLGDDFLEKEKYHEAVENYKEANTFIENPLLESRIDSCNKILKNEDEFKDILVKSNNLFTKGDYINAIKNYKKLQQVNYKTETSNALLQSKSKQAIERYEETAQTMRDIGLKKAANEYQAKADTIKQIVEE